LLPPSTTIVPKDIPEDVPEDVPDDVPNDVPNDVVVTSPFDEYRPGEDEFATSSTVTC